MLRAQSAQQNSKKQSQSRPIHSALTEQRLKKDDTVFQQYREDKQSLNVVQNGKRIESGKTRTINSGKSMAQELIEVNPKEVTFRDVQQNSRNELYVTIRNLSTQPRRIRFQQPKTLLFQVDYDMQQGVAAGLAIKILVSFLSSEPINNDYHDQLVVLSDDFRFEIQLHALRSSALLQFDKSLDFGYIQTGKEMRKTLTFKNKGVERGKINIKSDYLNQIKIEPNIFSLDPEETIIIEVFLKPKDMGNFRGSLMVQVDGGSLEQKIDISATCVDYSRLFLDDTGCQCSLIDFGEFYMGNQKVFSGTYINNTPKAYNYNIITKKGHQNNQEEISNFITPNELGVEQSERIIHVVPNKGLIQPYQTIKIQIVCLAPISLKSQILAKSFCYSPDRSMYSGMIQDFQYSLIFELDVSTSDDPMILHVQGKSVIPMLKLSRQILTFGECDVNNNREILLSVENIHPILKLDVTFAKISCFFFKPDKIQLKPHSKIPFYCSFIPKNIGNYNTQVDIILLDGLFKIPIKLQGESTKISQKRPQTRGPEAKQQDFLIDPKFIDHDNLDYQKRRKNELQDLHHGQTIKINSDHLVNGYFVDSQKTQTEKIQTGDLDLIAQREENKDQNKQDKDNKSKYNNFIVDQRQSRLEKQRKGIIQHRLEEVEKRMKEKGIQIQNFDATDPILDKDPKLSSPVDYEFEFGIGEVNLSEPVLPLPIAKQGLYLIKPIYEKDYPQTNEDEHVIFKTDPLQPVKKILPSRPQSHKQKNDILQELNSGDLKRILAGPIKIDFGTIYINSKMHRTFSVQNGIRSAIQCRMIPNKSEVQDTFSQSQIIDCAQTAQFDICIQVQGLGQFKHTLKYVINEIHFFDILLIANVETVNIEVNKNQMKFQFSDENTTFQTYETVKLTNNGSGTAYYKWIINDNNKFFNIIQREGEVSPHKSIDVQIIYSPSNIMKDPTDKACDQVFTSLKGKDPLNRIDEEKIVLKVENGLDQQIKCVGLVTDPKCIIKQTLIDINQIAVCTQGKGSFQIKNSSKQLAYYKILDDKLPLQCLVTPQQGKILGDETKDFIVTVESKIEITLEQFILIMLRSGRVMRILLQVQCIIPKVKIEQSIFDFGRVTTLGNQGSLPMTIRNESNVPVELVFDLRNEDQNPDMQEGVQYIQIIQTEDFNESLLKSIEGQDQDNQKQDPDSENEGQDNLNNSQSKKNSQMQKNQRLQLKLKAYQTINFELKICPKEIKKYQFILPVILNNYGPIDSLKRVVQCVGCKPKFLVEPQHLDFGRKIILTPIEKNTPITMEVLLSNPEQQSIGFRIDDASLQKDKVFQLIPTMGRVDGGQTLRLQVMFNPKLTGTYDKNLNLYLSETQQDTPYLVLQFSGNASKPRLLFDRREVILSAVPLNITSRATFKIINDGYQNMRFINKQLQDFTIDYPGFKFYIIKDGQVLGITKQQLTVNVSFQSNKTLSVTQILDFVDETQQTYSIPLSATADNCSFTNFPYLTTQEGNYTIQIQNPNEQFRSPLQLVEVASDLSIYEDKETEQLNKRGLSSRKTTTTQQQTKVTFQDNAQNKEGIIGVNDIMSEQELAYKCDNIKRWLNYFILITPLETFPGSLVDQNGSQLFELISFLSSKNSFPYKVCAGYEEIKQREERVNLLYNQYKELIFQLKTEGGLLNHIRPEHLMSYKDYSYYIKYIEAQSTMNQQVHTQSLKISQGKFDRLQIMAYLVIVYQILRLFYLPRVNLKQLKTHCPNLSVFENYISNSNVYGQYETLLLKWIENQLDVFHGLASQGQSTPHRILSMQDNLRNGHILSTLAMSYIGVGAQKYFRPLGMIAKVEQKQDINLNTQILQKAFLDVGIQSHFNQDDFKQMGHSEALLLLMTLYNTLPNYIPRQQPVVFNCILGAEVVKTIELTNVTLKTVAYWVKLDGSTDFILEDEDNLKIKPKDSIKYKVKFISRVSEEQQARITFINKRESNVIVGALVFDLKSCVVGRVSEKLWTVSSVLYEPKEFSITVVNKFQTSEFGNFQISIQSVKVKMSLLPHEILPPPKQKKKRSFMPQSEKSKKDQEKEDRARELLALQEKEEPFPAFFCQLDNIRLKRGASYNLVMQFIPLVFSQQKCYVIFQDNQVGEFQYEVIGTVVPPEVLIDIKPNSQIFLDQLSFHSQHVPLKNPLLRKARKLVEQVMIDRKKQSSTLLQKQLSNQNNIQQKKGEIPGGLQQENLFFVIPEEESYIKTEKQFTLLNYKIQTKPGVENVQNKAGSSLQEQEDRLSDQDYNSKLSIDDEDQQYQSNTKMNENLITFQFNFKTAVKDYIQYFTLMNQERTDIRRIRVTVTSIPKPIKAALEMTCPAREILIQDIPIMNNTERDFNIKATLTGSIEQNFTFFSLVQQSQSAPQNISQQDQLQIMKKQNNKDQVIKKKTNGFISLMFAPSMVCQAQAKLTLINPLTNDVFEYELRGIAEEPLSEGHIIINCKARQTKNHKIGIYNKSDIAVVYTIQTDLINASGLANITVQPKSTSDYNIIVTPMLSGQYTGQITFTDETTNFYMWFTILLDTESPNYEAKVDLVAPVRKAIAFDIELSNPLNENVTYEVIFNGEGLSGDQWFSVLPDTSSTYQLIFQPLKEGISKGNIAFIHPKLGEIWYELNLVGQDRGGIRLPQFRTELGKVDKQEVMLENPLGHEVQLQVQIINDVNFGLFPNQKEYVLAPYSQTPFYIQFTPSSLSSHSGEVLVISKEIGRWLFLCFGTGETPTSYEHKQIFCKIGQATTGQVEWKNPLKEQLLLQLNIIFEDQFSQDAFTLLTKKQSDRLVIPPQSNITIPYQFQPLEIRQYKCTVILAMTDKIKWTFPIIGQTESAQTNTVHNIQTKCRIPLQSKIQVDLSGISLSNKNDNFTFEIQDQSDNFKLLKKGLKIKLKKDYIDSLDEQLIFDIYFKPMRPFKQLFELVVRRKSGGIWKFQCHAIASDPEVDDVIVIESALNKQTFLTFKLTNRNEQFSPFQAYFAPDSNPEITVEPKQGLLEPFGKNGTEFKIGFKPREYGKRKEAKLFIQTEYMLWYEYFIYQRSYILKGHLPKYYPPQVRVSQIDNNLQKDIQQKLLHQDRKKNFVADKLKRANVISPKDAKPNPKII